MGTVGALLVKRVSRGSRGIQRDFREVHGEMIEQYKGYEIKVYWSNIEQGYVFCMENPIAVMYRYMGLIRK